MAHPFPRAFRRRSTRALAAALLLPPAGPFVAVHVNDAQVASLMLDAGSTQPGSALVLKGSAVACWHRVGAGTSVRRFHFLP